MGPAQLIIISILASTTSAAYNCVQYRHRIFTTYYGNICLPEGGMAPKSIGGVEEWWQPTKQTVLVPDCTKCASWGPKTGSSLKEASVEKISLRGENKIRAISVAPLRVVNATGVTTVANVTKPDELHYCCFYADRSSDDTETIHTLGMNVGKQCPSIDLGQHIDGVWNQDNMYNCQFFGPY